MTDFHLRKDQDWDGTLSLMLQHVSRLDHSKDHTISVERTKRERSDPQNKALWGVAYKALREQTGNDPEDLHTYFCGKYFGWQEYEVMGELRKRPIRTTTKNEQGKRDVIDRATLSDFYAFIQQHAAETIGAYVPDPDPEWWRDAA